MYRFAVLSSTAPHAKQEFRIPNVRGSVSTVAYLYHGGDGSLRVILRLQRTRAAKHVIATLLKSGGSNLPGGTGV